MVKYTPNNVGFRIVSSKIMESYKNSQAFNLSEISRDETHKFSTTAKEILLLKYDMWCRWLLDVEASIRAHNKCDRDFRKTLISMSNVVQSHYLSMMKSNPEYFEPEYVELWIKIHKPVYYYMTEAIINYDAKNIIDLITRIGDVVIMVMNATLHELYELDNIYYNESEDVFVSVTDMCIDYGNVFPDKCILGERLDILKEVGFGNSNIIVKRYVDVNINIIIKKLNAYGYSIKEVC